MPHSIVQRAQVGLTWGGGETNSSLAKRYRELGLEDLLDALRSSRPHTYEDDKAAEVINQAVPNRPEGGNTQ